MIFYFFQPGNFLIKQTSYISIFPGTQLDSYPPGRELKGIILHPFFLHDRMNKVEYNNLKYQFIIAIYQKLYNIKIFIIIDYLSSIK